MASSGQQGTTRRISCIYVGHIRHRRFLPVRNAFRYRMFMMYADLDELPHLLDGYRFWSYEKPNLASFQRRYYLGDAKMPVDASVRACVMEKAGVALAGPIRMLTHFRYLGYCYNPVTFYYCFDSTGTRVEVIVAQITNTPWGERFSYILDCRKNESTAEGHFQWTFPKAFHVSPFMPMNVRYDWRFSTPGGHLNVLMANTINGEKHFDASLSLARMEITQSALTRVLVSYPAMTAKAVAGIHWQAFKLWLKRTPFYEHPGRAERSANAD